MLMAATLSSHCSLTHPPDHRTGVVTSFRRHSTRKPFVVVVCSTSSNSPPKLKQSPSSDSGIRRKSPSLADQLRHLSTTTLSDPKTAQSHVLKSKPKSTWASPVRPKRSVLNPERQRRSQHSYNPQVKDLRLFAQKLNECESTESAFMAALEEMPHPPTLENALIILHSLRPWQKSYLFFNWVKAQNLFPMETIFYNVAMKSLRFGRQFGIIEELANEMLANEVKLDNITYSTIITCAKKCYQFDKAVEWFEKMYKTGLMPDEVTYSVILDVYAKLGKVEEVKSLYERGRATGWTPDPFTFAVLANMFGSTGDYDGIQYVLKEMRSVGAQPDLVVYNALLKGLGKAGKPGLARNLFDKMLDSGLTPDAKTLTALAQIYGKARWAKDALDLWETMRSNRWPMDFYLYNTLLNMCADLGLVEEAETLFQHMKQSTSCSPDSWSYTAMLNIYGSDGNVDKAMEVFQELSASKVQLNVMGCTCLIQCLGKAKRIDDVVRVFKASVDEGVKPDDRLCGCLLSVVSLCEERDDMDKVIECLNMANPKLADFVKLLLQGDRVSFVSLTEEFKAVISETAVVARTPFCNCLIDICRNRNLPERAHILLYLGTVFGLYPGLHNKKDGEWSLDVRSLSIGAAQTALEEWMNALSRIINRDEDLPEVLSVQTGTGTHKFSQGLAGAFASHIDRLSAPFRPSEEKAGFFVATREDVVLWVRSQTPA